MAKITKEKRQSTLAIIGKHVEKYRVMMIIALAFFVVAIIGLIIYWNYDDNDISPFIDYAYLISQIVVGVISLGMIAVLVLNKYKKINTIALAVSCHVYAVILMVWATGDSIIDLKIGMSPIVYLVVATLVSSLFILEPIFFTILSVGTFISIIVCQLIKGYDFFSNKYGVENLIYFIIFSVIIILIAFRHFNVTLREYTSLKEVERLTYYDELTSLLNERSYLNKIDEINQEIEENKRKPFAIILMDVNNLKATNDEFGHHYGCHLVVLTGHTLKEFFKTSSVYHIGGDEFLSIVEGEDYDKLDELLIEFEKTFRYSLIQYEGKQLIFSVARGYARYKDGDTYRDVLQQADDMMYQNKAEIKETYHLKKR